jgi:hypothetical protein
MVKQLLQALIVLEEADFVLHARESIELFTTDQAFFRSYDLAPPPPLSLLSLFISLPVFRRVREGVR